MMQKNMKRPFRGGLRLATLAVATLAGGWAVAQTIDDVPPAVQNNVPPNFMFMIDNSGSMSNIVLGAPYDPAVTYTSSCSGTYNAATRLPG